MRASQAPRQLTSPVAADGLPHVYALTGPNGEDLSEVPGLSFDPSTRVLSGTPTRAGATTVTYRATNNGLIPPVTHTGSGLDAGTAAGWGIPRQLYRRAGGTWVRLDQTALAIRLKGTAKPLPAVAVAPVASPVEEGANAQFRVTRTAVTAGVLTVNYRVSETGRTAR